MTREYEMRLETDKNHTQHFPISWFHLFQSKTIPHKSPIGYITLYMPQPNYGVSNYGL